VTNDDAPGIAGETAGHYHRLGWWRDTTVLDDFLRNAATQPGKTAIISDHADREREQHDYGQLAALTDRVAAGLLGLGVRPGEIVSFQLPNWWEFAVMHLACARVGAVTNAILPILRHREVQFILERTQSRLCVVPARFRGFDYAEMLLEVQQKVPTLRHVLTAGPGDPPPGARRFEECFLTSDGRPADLARLNSLRPDPDSTATVQFTSGTTGVPKGVVHTYNTIWAGTASVSGRVGLTGDDTLLAVSPMAHTIGFYYGVVLPMAAGMTVVYQDTWDPVRMLDLISGYQVTWTMTAPTFLSDLCATAERTGITVPSMRHVSCAGAPVAPALISEVRKHLGAAVLTAWGMTEVGAVTTTLPDDTTDHIIGTDGSAPPWTDLKVVGPDGETVPYGTVGRLLIRGASNFTAYYKRPDLLEAALHDGWFDTGDLAWQQPDGYIRIQGRTKDIIIRGAENIPVVEVESALLAHPAVREAAVIAVTDDRLGERACAVIVPADPGAPPSLADLTAHLAALSMAKQFWPEYVRIVEVLPKTATGKIQKFLLREGSRQWDLRPARSPSPRPAATGTGEP
jgi:cyclohexanecarboxylate-CoA ligase